MKTPAEKGEKTQGKTIRNLVDDEVYDDKRWAVKALTRTSNE